MGFYASLYFSSLSWLTDRIKLWSKSDHIMFFRHKVKVKAYWSGGEMPFEKLGLGGGKLSTFLVAF
jgi:hypothetical protein